jgi:hypothetical protein
MKRKNKFNYTVLLASTPISVVKSNAKTLSTNSTEQFADERAAKIKKSKATRNVVILCSIYRREVLEQTVVERLIDCVF